MSTAKARLCAKNAAHPLNRHSGGKYFMETGCREIEPESSGIDMDGVTPPYYSVSKTHFAKLQECLMPFHVAFFQDGGGDRDVGIAPDSGTEYGFKRQHKTVKRMRVMMWQSLTQGAR